MELVTFAGTGGSPIAISVGKVIREPPPATAFTALAAKPASRRAHASIGLIASYPGRRDGRVGRAVASMGLRALAEERPDSTGQGGC